MTKIEQGFQKTKKRLFFISSMPDSLCNNDCAKKKKLLIELIKSSPDFCNLESGHSSY